jgi:hypothetical protein
MKIAALALFVCLIFGAVWGFGFYFLREEMKRNQVQIGSLSTENKILQSQNSKLSLEISELKESAKGREAAWRGAASPAFAIYERELKYLGKSRTSLDYSGNPADLAFVLRPCQWKGSPKDCSDFYEFGEDVPIQVSIVKPKVEVVAKRPKTKPR